MSLPHVSARESTSRRSALEADHARIKNLQSGSPGFQEHHRKAMLIANVIPLFVCKEAERDTVAALPMWRGRTGFPAFI